MTGVAEVQGTQGVHTNINKAHNNNNNKHMGNCMGSTSTLASTMVDKPVTLPMDKVDFVAKEQEESAGMAITMCLNKEHRSKDNISYNRPGGCKAKVMAAMFTND